jgi:hypothetical protein
MNSGMAPVSGRNKMTTVTKIVYAANNGSMGSMSNRECDAYRAWAANEIQAEYPDAELVIDASDCAQTRVVAADFYDEQDAMDFLFRLWDRQ